MDICGPADGVRRASIERRKGKLMPLRKPGGSGTSYATALCAGIGALWLAQRRADLTAAYGNPNWRWPAALKRLLKETADCPTGWDRNEWGRGLYRADRLLVAPLPAAGSLHEEAKAGDPFDPKA